MSTATLSLYVQNCQESYKVQARCEKTCLWRFHKGHNQGRCKGQRRSCMPIFEIQLVETKQSSQYDTHIHCVLFAKLVSKVMYILNIRYYITENDLSLCRHMNRRGS